jgi:DNA-binding CsgD family transcriptional regulator
MAVVHVRATALGLTSREARSLAHVAEGYTDEETARRLRLSVYAVRYSIRTAMVRLGAVNRPHAVALAVARGVLEVRE